MSKATSARDEVLGRIRSALGSTGNNRELIESHWTGIDRNYRRKGELAPPAMLDQFEDRLRDYDAHVERAGLADLTGKMGELLCARGVRRLVIPVGLGQALSAPLPDGFEFVPDDALSAAELDGLDGVVTGCTVAIAQTGTLILQNVSGQGRRAPTLVPDYHLCVVREDDVVETVPEAFAKLQPTATLATTFISGPSATADIEMTRIKGVHGPRFLDVILVR